MKYGVKLVSYICVATSVVFCLGVLFFSTTHFDTRVHAESAAITGIVSSSPSSGPVGATISVSGSGWSDEPDGEQVSLGYMIASNCVNVPDAQASAFSGGSFSGTLHLPDGTQLGIYTICASFGSTIAVANTFTVLTESSPQISISLPRQPGEQEATVSGSNYLPSGTTVNLYWETTNGNVILTISPAVSNSNGLISSTFRIPTSVANGSYKIVATISGQPTLNTSVTFTYNAITPTPSPTPVPTPSPTAVPASDPTPTKHVSPTAVATAAISTPTVGTTSLVGSQNTNTGQTPSPGTTSDNSHTYHVPGIVLIGSLTGMLAILAIILMIVLSNRRKKARSDQITAAVGSTQNSPMAWQNSQFGSIPYPTNNGSMTVSTPWPATSTPPQQLQISPYTHLLQNSEGGSPVSSSEPSNLNPGDPYLESIKQQVQVGLFATSTNHSDD